MIEEKIDKLISAIERLTETLQNMPSVDQIFPEGPATKEEEKLAEVHAALLEQVEGGKTKKAKKEKVAPAPVAAPEPEPEPTPAPVAAPEITLSQIREAAQKALDNGKLDQVVAINKEYGLKRISDAATEQWPEILAKLEALNNG